jgi:hypothetical protein
MVFFAVDHLWVILPAANLEVFVLFHVVSSWSALAADGTHHDHL